MLYRNKAKLIQSAVADWWSDIHPKVCLPWIHQTETIHNLQHGHFHWLEYVLIKQQIDFCRNLFHSYPLRIVCSTPFYQDQSFTVSFGILLSISCCFVCLESFQIFDVLILLVFARRIHPDKSKGQIFDAPFMHSRLGAMIWWFIFFLRVHSHFM